MALVFSVYFAHFGAGHMRYIPVLAGLLALAPFARADGLQPGQSVQQQFESASAALAEEDWDEALQGFEALEARLEEGASRRSVAIVRVRKASALLRLGRHDEAAAALRLGLPDLPADDASLNEDRFLGLLTLGELAERSVDYAQARRHYRDAVAIDLPPLQKLAVYRGLIQTQMFEDAPAALASADEGLALAGRAEAGDAAEGILRSFRGRVLLNMGRYEEARAELRRAVARLGGLTRRVDVADVVTRHDLALAAHLAGDREDARRYLAYTGAGHFETGLSPSRGRLVPPPCGDGLDPGDVAVVEYTINADGTVGRATPIYASRPGASALKFAEAVLGWGWDPEAFGEMPALLRTAMRVELRCSHVRTADATGAQIDETRRWAAGRGIDWPEDGRFPVRPIAAIRAELRRAENEAEPDRPQLLRALIELAYHPGVGNAETAAFVRRALPIAGSEQAPPVLVAGLANLLVMAEHQAAGHRLYDRAPDYARMLEYPAIRDNPRALAALRLAQALAFFAADAKARAGEAASLALSTPGLPAGDQVRGRIRQLQAVLAAADGDMAAARAAFADAGPAADACEILPQIRQRGGRPSDFPNPALRWGFEGWATVEAFILSDGSLSRPRTVMAYPPFVFDEAAEDLVGRSRSDPYPGPPGTGCPSRVNTQFRIAAF